MSARLSAQEKLEQADAYVAKLNRELLHPHNRQTKERVHATVDRELRRWALVDAFDVRVTELEHCGATRYQVATELRAVEWARRRRYDGFTVLVAHELLPCTAAELSQLYRAKDAVEKDFQTIKSVLDVRPIWHRSCGKVRAHVSVCMLALLLQKTLADQLAGTASSATAALEILADCRLNQYPSGRTPLYTSTTLNPEQNGVLRALKLQHLGDDTELAGTLLPR